MLLQPETFPLPQMHDTQTLVQVALKLQTLAGLQDVGLEDMKYQQKYRCLEQREIFVCCLFVCSCACLAACVVFCLFLCLFVVTM